MTNREIKVSDFYNNAMLLLEYKPSIYSQAKEYYLNVLDDQQTIGDEGFGFLKAVRDIYNNLSLLSGDSLKEFDSKLNTAYKNYCTTNDLSPVNWRGEIELLSDRHMNTQKRNENNLNGLKF